MTWIEYEYCCDKFKKNHYVHSGWSWDGDNWHLRKDTLSYILVNVKYCPHCGKELKQPIDGV